MKRMIFAAMCSLALMVGCDKGSSSETGSSANGKPDAKKLRVVAIPKATSHVFWKSVEAGVKKAGDELGVEVVWKGPPTENDRAQQIAVVQQFIADGVGGILLAPLDDTALKGAVDAANAAKIPVVIMDSALKGEVGKDFVSFVATDNKRGGSLAGDELARLLGGKGKVVLLRYQEGSASTAEREAGFLEAIKKSPEIQVIVDNRYGGATVDSAKAEAMRLIDRIQEADGVFAPNESSTFGLLLALKQSNLAGKKKFVGFDTAPSLITALNAGEIDALVAQNPNRMGYEGIKALVEHIRGTQVSGRIDTGCVLITKQNIDSPEVKEALK